MEEIENLSHFQPVIDIKEKENLLKRTSKCLSQIECTSPNKRPLLMENGQDCSEIDLKNDKGDTSSKIEVPESSNKSNDGENLVDEKEKGNSSPTEQEASNEIKLERQKVKRRRSSFGRYLSTANTSTNTDSVCHKADLHENLKNTDGMKSPEKNPGGTKEDKLLNYYKVKSQKLETEYKQWKRLRRLRKQKALEAERYLSEARKGETVIEEDDVAPYLTEEEKAFLSAKPDYSQYLQEIKLASKCLRLTQQEVERVTHTYKNFLTLSQITAQSCNEILKEKILGDIKERDPKKLLKSLIDVGNQTNHET